MFKIIVVRFGQVILAIVWLYALSNTILVGAAALCDYFKVMPNGAVNISLRRPFSTETMLVLFFFYVLFKLTDWAYKWLSRVITADKQGRI